MRKVTDTTPYHTNGSLRICRYDNVGAGADSPDDWDYWEVTLLQEHRTGLYHLSITGKRPRTAIIKAFPDHTAACAWTEEYLAAEIAAREDNLRPRWFKPKRPRTQNQNSVR